MEADAVAQQEVKAETPGPEKMALDKDREVMQESSEPASPENEEDRPKMSTAQVAMLLGVIWSILIFPLLDETMIAALLAPISASFNSLSNLSWIATTYLIGMAASNPLSGHLADVFGRQYCLVAASAIFVVGTLICGLSTRLWVLLLGRSIQGFGSGIMQAVVSFIEADVVTLRNRGVTEAVGGLLVGVCMAVGGLYGGGLNNTIGWKWAFLIQAPITTVLAIGAWFLVKLPVKKSGIISTLRRLDYVGGIAMLVAIVLFQLGLQSGATFHSWKSTMVLVALPLSLVAFIIFLVWDLYFAKEPLLPMKVLYIRNIYLSSVFYLLNSMSYFSIEFYVAIYLQVLGHSTTATGLRFIPQAAASAASTMLAGLLVKITGKYYLLNVVAQIFAILGAALLLLLHASSPSWYPFVFLGLAGAGFGTSWVSVLMACLSSITDDQQASVQSAGYFFRFTGMALGMTVSTAVFQKVLKDGLLASFGGDEQLIDALRTDFSMLQSLSFQDKQKAQGDYMKALHAVFYTVIAEAVIAAIASLFFKENEISDDPKKD